MIECLPPITSYNQLHGLVETLQLCDKALLANLHAAGVPEKILNDPASFGIMRHGNRFAFLITDSSGIIDVAVSVGESLTQLELVLGAAFALGEDQIENPGTYSFGGKLMVHRTPVEWLRAGCAGIYIIDKRKIASRLRGLRHGISAPPGLAELIDEEINSKQGDVYVRLEEDE